LLNSARSLRPAYIAIDLETILDGNLYKAAVKMHTLRHLRGTIPSFIHVSDGKLHDVKVLDPRLRGGRLC
jgi:hypothetical protein